ncbi:MAG: DUF3592 domain-containing protein [Gammaproteobacteria bacterium]|nr:DUF3592 domain-containing protein [Gammaproteobacteria bacterium]
MLDILWLILLLFMLWHFWRARQFLAQTQYWLIAKGRITLFEWTREGPRLWPKIQYTYQVFDHDYLGEYLFLDTSLNNPNSKYARQVAYRAAMAYEDDAEIDVFYNPNNPNQAVLDTTIPRKLNLIISLLLALIILHLAVVVHHLL